MKNSTIILALLATTTVLGVSKCDPSAKEQMENAKVEVTEAEKDLVKANAAYKQDMVDYKNETMKRISANEKTIGDFKESIKSEKKKAKENYETTLAVLEQENTDLKVKLNAYQDDGMDKWEMFKAEFTNDMDELGDAFSNLTKTDKE